MDARQKYTEANECVVSEEFLESIRTFNRSVAINIGALLDKTIHQVDENMIMPQHWGGVVDDAGNESEAAVMNDVPLDLWPPEPPTQLVLS